MWIFERIWCLQYNCITKSSSEFISAAERVSDEPRMVNSCNTSFGTVTKTFQDELHSGSHSLRASKPRSALQNNMRS